MKITRRTIAIIVEWLKKNLTLAAILAAVTLLFTVFKNRPAQIALEFKVGDELMNVENKDNFVNLLVPFYRFSNLLDEPQEKVSSGKFPDGLPRIVNNTKKSITHLKMEIYISCDDYGLKQSDFSQHYECEKVFEDTVSPTYILRYKKDVLNAKSSIPIPIIKVQFYEEYPYQGDSYISLRYTITYDEIKKPLVFNVNYRICCDPKVSNGDNASFYYLNSIIEDFLDDCYNDGCFTENRRESLVTVLDENTTQIAIPPKHLNSAKFEKFKKEFIENRKIIYGYTK